MKIDTKEAVVESDIDFGDAVAMSISTDGMQHIMSLLTNLYNDPELAVIREYYTNALDAMVEAGNTDPVQVFLPTRDNPLFVVKDTGIGMSEEDIRNIYSKYGASTKRSTNDQVGAFGLGCKSALTIATQFTLTANKNGKRTTALISKTESGINSVKILPTKPTDEPSGVTITIPVPNVSSFNEKALKFFKFGDTSKVRVNGHHPTSVVDDAKVLDIGEKDVKLFAQINNTSYGTRTFTIIMGNVPYNVSYDKINESRRRTGLSYDFQYGPASVYAYVGIGAVDLTPSREGLRYTNKTTDILDTIFKGFVENVKATAQAEIDAVTDRHEVFKVISSWRRVLDRPMWNGVPIVYSVKFMNGTASKYVPYVERSTSGSSTHGSTYSINTDSEGIIVHGPECKDYRKISKYLGYFLRSIGKSRTKFYFVEDISTLTDPWILDNKNITFYSATKVVEDGKAFRKEEQAANRQKNPVARKQGKTEYPVLDLYKGTVSNLPYDQIADGTPYLSALSSVAGSITELINTGYYPTGTTAQLAGQLSKFTTAKHVVLIPKRLMVSAYEKRVEGTYSVLKDVEEKISSLESMVDQRVIDLYRLEYDKGHIYWLTKTLKNHGLHTDILDADIRKLINPTKKAKVAMEKIEKYSEPIRWFKPGYNLKTKISSENTSELIDNISSQYVLLEGLNTRYFDKSKMEHVVDYINAIYTKNLTVSP